jgi:chaperonin GroES
MTTTLRPLNTRIIVRPDEPESRSRGGIIIPDNAKEKKARGTVVAVGPGMLMKTGERWPMPPISPGDRVLYSKYAGQEVKIDDVLHIVIRDEDCMAGGKDDAHLTPIHDKVIVRADKAADKTAGGLIIPDVAKDKPLEGEVVAVGAGKILKDGKMRPLDVQAGDRVKFGKFSGFDVEIGGEEFKILHEDDLLGVVATA